MENFKEEKVSRKKKPGLLRRLAALAAAAALALSLAACDGSVPSIPGGSADVVPNPAASAASSVDAPLEVHFIDVGQALSVLVECDGQFMLYSWNMCSAPMPMRTMWVVWRQRWPTSRRTMCTPR